MSINYGLDRVRFPSPARAGAKVRGGARFESLTRGEGFAQLVIEVTIEIEGETRPACVARAVVRLAQ
jgi:acyl dehydratase